MKTHSLRRTAFSLLLLASTALAVDTTTVFNEVMYHPAGAADPEWIELHNEMAVNMDLSGWEITGGVDFTFPDNVVIPAGGYLVVSSNPAALQAAEGIAGVLGPWSGSLNNAGETIRLRDRTGRVMDELTYNDKGRWPVGADGSGMSLVRPAGHWSGAEPEHWEASAIRGGTPGSDNLAPKLGPAQTLFGLGDPWLYQDKSAGLPAGWQGTNYTAGTGGWLAGNGILAFEDAPLPAPVGTVLASPASHPTGTYYFQKQFTFSGAPSAVQLTLRTLLDDGAVIYLNGQEVARQRMPSGSVTATTPANNEVADATFTDIVLPATALVNGTNTLSVEVHQAGTPLSVFKLMATGGHLDNATDLALPGTPFAKDVIAGYSAHSIPHLNDGLTGNSFSWIGGTANSFCGIGFPSALSIGRIAFARDNTGIYTDRTLGSYVVQSTTVPNPTAATPDASWITIGTLTIEASIPSPSLRHVYEFPAVNATGIRILTPSGACIDELELYAPAAPDVVWGAALEARAIIPQPAPVPLRISEVAGTSAATWRVELQNTGATPLEIGGLVLAYSGAQTTGYTLPSQMLAPGAMLVLDETTLGFRPLPDDRIFLLTAGGAALIDAVTVKTITRARDSLGRMLVPTADTFGTANTFSLNTDVVINEVMYHYPPNPSTPTQAVTDNPEEWIELHNKGEATVNLAGWSLSEAVSFTFPAGTTLAPHGYLVVAKDAAALAAKWPERAASITANFSGSLSNSGERIVLEDATGNPAGEVRYFTGGAWPELPDGGGASLELRDPRADASNGASWSASNETGGTAWQNVSYTMTAGQTFGQTPLWNEFRIGMLDAGECLVDDVSVVRVSSGQQLIQGGDFSSFTNKWRMLGNHGTSTIEPEPGNPSNAVLHVRATGPFAWNHNHIETTFTANTALVDGESYTVSFRARWLGGSNQLNTRAYYSRLARTTELALPARIGTPGAPNSRLTANIGPALAGLAHTPIVPDAGEPVTVSLTANDPDGMGAVNLRYALNGSASFASVPMTTDGATYSAQIPGQAAGTIVQFYVQAADAAGAASMLPAAGANSRALYIVDDGAGTTLSAHELRIIMLPADCTNLLATLNRLSDARTGGTAIYQRNEVFYDVGVRLQGTAAGRVRDGEQYPGYDIAFPRDHLFRGVHDSVNIDRSGRSPVVRGQDEIYVKHLFHRAGVPCTYDDLVYLIAPDSIHTGTAILQMAGYESEFVASQFGGDGTVFNLDGTYEPSTTIDGNPESLKNPVPLATQIHGDFTNLGIDKEQYRGQLEPRAGRRRDDFSGLIPMCQTMALPDAQLGAQIGEKLDVDEWMRVAAIYSLWGIDDCYLTGGFSHNLRLHVPSDGRAIRALPWDMDFVMGRPSTSPAILASGNLLRVINNAPGARHAYYGHLHDLCSTAFTSGYLTPWLEHYGSVVGQTMTGAADYVEARRSAILSQLPASTAFAITSNGGSDFSVNTASTTLAGTGWINVREIRRSDTEAVLDVAWMSDTNWQANVALNYGANPITLTAYDFSGALVGTDSITITSTLATPAPRDFLRITEIHYHPAPPTTPAELAASSDAEDFEFIELQNFAAQTLDIGGCKFTAGVNYTFPSGTTLASNETILIVRNGAAFPARYGTALRTAGAYGPADSLSNSGETITLVDASGAVIESFTYDDAFPWPTNADGPGYSLVAIAPQLTLDRNLSTSWRSSVSIGGNPGGSDASHFTGTPNTDADADGLNAFLEYALGTSDAIANDEVLTLSREPGGTFTLTFTSRLNADDVAINIESCTALPAFLPASSTLVASTQNGTTLVQTWRVAPPVGATSFFVRLKATAR